MRAHDFSARRSLVFRVRGVHPSTSFRVGSRETRRTIGGAVSEDSEPTTPGTALEWCPACGGSGNSTPDPYGVCASCAGLGRVPGVKVAAVLVVEERSAEAKEGPWSEPVPVCLAKQPEASPWCEPYVVSNRWIQSRAIRYERSTSDV